MSAEGYQPYDPAQAEVVQPRQLPDGLLEVRLQGEATDDLYLLEVATYPERRVTQQIARDLLLVWLDRHELPESIVLVLAPKGKYRVPRECRLQSRRGTSRCTVKWNVVELWTVPAEELLKPGDVGLAPWVMLATSSAEPVELAQRCRDVIDRARLPPRTQRANTVC